MEDRIIVLDDFLMELERNHIYYIDIGLGDSKDACDLVVLPLLQIFNRDSFEFLKRVGAYMYFEPI